ncbi:unnamed protein product [Blepharisma stoltei]|uniref:Uncharacterized protein n=1 Tax=Blepharisma stoltei TaxID=1481888 RepID=A0AAU9KCV5_9CILI|nr:unnamed protein product [Blepharisma stoltei]
MTVILCKNLNEKIKFLEELERYFKELALTFVTTDIGLSFVNLNNRGICRWGKKIFCKLILFWQEIS